MSESITTVFIIGLIAGFLFSMPIAGPISIMVVYNAIKGKLRYCIRLALGASIVEFFYVFIVVYGMSSLYKYYASYIPYILYVGALFLFVLGFKILRENFSIENLNTKEAYSNKGGLRTGILLNLSNPTLLLGWLTSSFVALSFASSIGFNTGDLDVLVGSNSDFFLNHDQNSMVVKDEAINAKFELSMVYALGVALGCYIWFYILTKIIVKYRNKIKVFYINMLTKIFGLCLLCIGIYLIWQGFILQ